MRLTATKINDAVAMLDDLAAADLGAVDLGPYKLNEVLLAVQVQLLLELVTLKTPVVQPLGHSGNVVRSANDD